MAGFEFAGEPSPVQAQGEQPPIAPVVQLPDPAKRSTDIIAPPDTLLHRLDDWNKVVDAYWTNESTARGFVKSAIDHPFATAAKTAAAGVGGPLAYQAISMAENLLDRPDPNYKVAADPVYQGADPQLRDRLTKAKNGEDALRIAAKVKEEREARDVMDKAGWFANLTAGAVVMSTDPVTLALAAATGGGSIAESLLGNVARVALVEAGTEAVKQSQQETRPWEQSALNIGLAPVLSTVLSSRSLLRIAKNEGWETAVFGPANKTYRDVAGYMAGEPFPATPLADPSVVSEITVTPKSNSVAMIPGEITINQTGVGKNPSATFRDVLRGLFTSGEYSPQELQAGRARLTPNGTMDVEATTHNLPTKTGFNDALKETQDGYKAYLDYAAKQETFPRVNIDGEWRHTQLDEKAYRGLIGRTIRRGGDAAELTSDPQLKTQLESAAKRWTKVDDFLLDMSQEAGAVFDAAAIRAGFFANGTAKGHLMRLPDKEAIARDPMGLLGAIKGWIKSQDEGLVAAGERAAVRSETELAADAQTLFQNFTGIGAEPRPYFSPGGAGKAIKGREWLIPDSVIEPWLINDPERVIRSQVYGQGGKAVFSLGFQVRDPEGPALVNAIHEIADDLHIAASDGRPVMPEVYAKIAELESKIEAKVKLKGDLGEHMKQLEEEGLLNGLDADIPKLRDLQKPIIEGRKDLEQMRQAAGSLIAMKNRLAMLRKMEFNDGWRLAPQRAQIAAEFDKKLTELARPELTEQWNKMAALKSDTLDYLDRSREYLIGANYRGSAEERSMMILKPMREMIAAGTLGLQILSQAAEAANPLLHAGMKENALLLKGFVTDFKATVANNRDMAHLAGIMGDVSEDTLNSLTFGSHAAMKLRADFNNSIAQRVFKATGSLSFFDAFNTMEKKYASQVSASRLLRFSEKGFENLPKDVKAELLTDGIDAAALKKIGTQFKLYGEKRGFNVARWMDWTDTEAKDAFSTYVRKQVRMYVGEPTLGQLPFEVKTGVKVRAQGKEVAHTIGANTELGKSMLLFRNFVFSTHENIYRKIVQKAAVNGVSEDQIGHAANVAAFIMASSALGWGSEQGKKIVRGQSDQISFAPDDVARDILKSTNYLSLFTQANDAMEALVGTSPLVMAGVAPNNPASENPKWDFVQRTGPFLGPTVRFVDNAGRGAEAAYQYAFNNVTPARRDIRAGLSVLPGLHTIGLAPLAHLIEFAVAESVGAKPGKPKKPPKPRGN